MGPWTRGLFSIKPQRANEKAGKKRPVGRVFKRRNILSRRYENVIHNRLPVSVLMYVLTTTQNTNMPLVATNPEGFFPP